MQINVIKQNGALYPVSEIDREVLNKLPVKVYRAEVSRPRNIKHHRKLFKLINIFLQNQEVYTTSEQVLSALKLSLGYYDIVQAFNGHSYCTARSVSFAKMDQDEFETFYNASVDLMALRLGITRQEFLDNCNLELECA